MEEIWDKLWDAVVDLDDLAVLPIVGLGAILASPIGLAIIFLYYALYLYLPLATTIGDKVTVLGFAYGLVVGLAVSTSWYARNVIVRLYFAYKRKGK